MFSNPDHDYRARQDLKGDDKYRYENGMMSDRELRNLEAGYYADDARKRAREEDERYHNEQNKRFREDDRGSSYSGGSSDGGSYSGSSYSSGSSGGGSYIGSLMRVSQDYLNQAYYYKEIAKNPNLPDKTRQEAVEKVHMYSKRHREVEKKIKKRTKKDSREASKGGVWGVIIVLVILYFIFFS